MVRERDSVSADVSREGFLWRGLKGAKRMVSFGADERAQAIQIGAVLLFGILVLAFASYQAFVVPSQNREVEFNHNQQIQQGMTDLRTALLSAADGSTRPVSLSLGTRYPSRLVAMNPGPPGGALRTVGTDDGRVSAWLNDTVAAGEVGDFWDGTNRNVTTGALGYRPQYNEYRSAPATVYGGTVLYNEFRDRDVAVSGQRLIEGNRINLVTLDGSLGVTQGGTVSVDPQPVSASTRTVTVTNAPGESITVSVPTGLPKSEWDDLLAGQPRVVSTAMDPIAGTEFQWLRVTLQSGREYELKMARVGVGEGVRDTAAEYLTDVIGNDSDVPAGGRQQVAVEVRDRFNNPIGDKRVWAETTLAGSSVSPASATTNAAGRATFSYEAPESAGGASVADTIRFSYVGQPGSNFDGEAAENVSMPVTVRGSPSPGAYTVDWQDPSSKSGTLEPCDDRRCILNTDTSSTLGLDVSTSPTADDARVEYAVNDTSVATVSPNEDRTDTSGASSTTLTTQSEGWVKVFASSGADGDVIDVNVTSLSTSTGPAGFSSVRTTSILPYANSQVQRLTFTPDQDLPNGETVTIDLSAAQQTSTLQVNYGSGSASVQQGSGSAGFNSQGANSATVVFTSNGVTAGSQVVVRVTGITAGTPADQSNPYSVSFGRSDGGSSSDSFAAAFDDGTAELSSTSASAMTAGQGGQTQTIRFTPSTALQSGETVVVDLSDAQSGSGNQAQVDYQTANGLSIQSGSGSAQFTQQNTDDATIEYTAGGGGDGASSTVEIDINGLSTGNPGNSPGTYTVGFSREDADTTSTTFDVN